MYRFLVIFEKANGNYSAYSPDLPGCGATGATLKEAEQNMQKALEIHLRGLLKDKLPIPVSDSFAEYMAVQLDQVEEPKMMRDSDQPSQDSEPKDMMSVEELAGYLQVPKSWIYERTSRNAISHHKVGRYIRFTKDDIKALLASFQRGPGKDKKSV